MKYDAIVIGSGMTGGWAAKELSEAGLKTLILEKGRNLKHGDYPTAHLDPWELPNHGKLSLKELKEYPIQSKCGYVTHTTKHYFVKDKEEPYHQELPFDWIRGNHVGGNSLVWGRQVYRWSDMDFEANLKEGIEIDWPIRYKDLAPWYDYVERYIGVSGKKEGLAHVPDGIFLPPMEYLVIEKYFVEQLKKVFDDRIATIGRTANLTVPHNGRNACQYRNRCTRGCPYGAYFSSVSSTLPAAFATGNTALRPFSIVKEIVFDDATQKATGVVVIDANSKKEMYYESDIIFLNASTVGTTKILLQSKSSRFPGGLGNDSGVLGHYLMDHHCYAGASGESERYQDRYFKGRRPNIIYIPRFQNLPSDKKKRNYSRGFQYQGIGSRENWYRNISEFRYGKGFKEALLKPGKWKFGLAAYGESLPYKDNYLYLHPEKKDLYGLPQVAFHVEWKENELRMRPDMVQEAVEMLKQTGFNNIVPFDEGTNPGNEIHEMGTARMGKDPTNSVVNNWNQIHAVKNVFITDGACMTSSACQNPSLTYMALTARACNYAIKEYRNGRL